MVKVPTPYLAFSGTILAQGLGHLIIGRWEWTSRLSIQPRLCGRGWGPQFFFFFPWFLAEAETLLTYKFSIWLHCPIPGPLVRKSQLVLGLFLVCARWYFQLLTSSASSPGDTRQNENPGNSLLHCFRFPNSLAGLPSCLHLSESS